MQTSSRQTATTLDYGGYSPQQNKIKANIQTKQILNSLANRILIIILLLNIIVADEYCYWLAHTTQPQHTCQHVM